MSAPDFSKVTDQDLLVHWVFAGMADVFEEEARKKKDSYMDVLRAEIERRGLLMREDK